MDADASRKRRLRLKPEILRLERRECPITLVKSLLVTPALLAPANNRYVAVQVEGKVTETNRHVRPQAQFTVVDEYAVIQPHGQVALTRISPNDYVFQFKIVLQAKRASGDPSGRQYNIIVGSQDYQNANGLAVTALVPKNQMTQNQTAHTKSVANWKLTRLRS